MRSTRPNIQRQVAALLAVLATLFAARASAAAQTIRVVAYNIAADVSGYTTPRDGLYTVLEAIGENYVDGAAHPLDILALEETTSNTTTVAPIVAALNAYYGAGTYAASSYQATQYGSASVGNGPNAMVYNTRTLTLVESVGVGTPMGVNNGEYRQVARYQFLPAGGVAGTQFYVYVSHMKSSYGGTTPTILASRAKEAAIIVADIKTLPANGGVLAMGDFNMDGSTEDAYQTLTAPGAYQLLDPPNPTLDYTEDWSTAPYVALMSESATALAYRDDIEFMSAAVSAGTSVVGLRYVAGSCRVFGNNGSVASGKSVNTSTNTALDGLQGPITPADARAALATASDHLPAVADYTVATPFTNWQARYFTASELANAAIGGNAADPDGDGISNLLEYALNLPPRTAGVAGLPAVGVTTVSGGKYLTLTFTRVTANVDISYVPQVSGDLVTWTSGVNATGVVSTTNNPDGLTQTVVVRDLTPLGSGGRRFIRLAVTMP